MKKYLAAWLVLGMITVAAGLSLSVTNEITKEPIHNQSIQAEAKAKQEVLPEAESFEVVELPEDSGMTLFAGMVGEETVGYVGKVTVNGYGGPIDVITGVDLQGLVKGINVGGPSFSETAGLGAKSRETAFTSQFADKVSPIRVVKASDPKTESSVDTITAATITSNAVVGGVNRIAKQVDNILNPQEEGPVIAAEGTTYTASQQGFAGSVAVFVTVKDDGTISALKVGDDSFSESEGYGANALADDFTKQFVGKSLPIKAEDVEAISGATITTTAVINAINQAFEEKNAIGPSAPEGLTYTAQKQGFAGPVAVQVTIKDDATITALTIGDDQFAETENYGAQALEPDFVNQFIGKSLPISKENIEAISGATFTTTAIIDALNDAFEQSKAAPGASMEEAPTEAPMAETTPEAEPAVEADMKTASKQGFAGPVAVQVSFNDDGSVKSLIVGDDAFAETAGLGAKAKDAEFIDQFIGKVPPLSLRKADEEISASTIDAITGATMTSQAVVDAINEVANPAEEASPAEAPKMYMAEAQGYGSPVAVEVAFTAENTIAQLKIGDDRFAETPGLGAKALDDDFVNQFVGKALPIAKDDIDAITGATMTTQAVIDAINLAFEAYQKDAAPVADGKVIAVAKQGYAGPVAVEVTFNADGTIEAIMIGDDQFMETAGLGAKAKDAEFSDQLIGKLPPLSLLKAGEEPTQSTIDGITSATLTSQAVVDAINEAFEQFNK